MRVAERVDAKTAFTGKSNRSSGLAISQTAAHADPAYRILRQ